VFNHKVTKTRRLFFQMRFVKKNIVNQQIVEIIIPVLFGLPTLHFICTKICRIMGWYNLANRVGPSLRRSNETENYCFVGSSK
jgi:hypothetical protein